MSVVLVHQTGSDAVQTGHRVHGPLVSLANVLFAYDKLDSEDEEKKIVRNNAQIDHHKVYCVQEGEGVKTSKNLGNVVYGWSLFFTMLKYFHRD